MIQWNKVRSVQYNKIYYSAVGCSTLMISMVKIMKYCTESIVKCSIVQYNTEKYMTIKCNSWQTVQYNIERYTTMAYIRVHNNTVELCTMLYNAM